MFKKEHQKADWERGVKKGIPIALGYLPVSFTFGLFAVEGGVPAWLAVFISISNVTSAGQFAGTKLIFAQAGYVEIILTTIIINLRYMLMSLSLSQKIQPKMERWQRMALSFGITDETFSVASVEIGKISFPYMLGLISCPIAGWTIGTAAGACLSSALPAQAMAAMGIALYCMFIAIIVPPAKKERTVLLVILLSIALTCVMQYVSLFSFISEGFRVILSTIIAAAFGAWV
ncbi:MAG: AzlC family ABC transporter permease, partial [Clostridia bacterium]|nr:AzlC family ABC transporter permease [Clostridia bacterium]